MARSRRRHKHHGSFYAILLLSGVVGISWWLVLRPTLPRMVLTSQALEVLPTLVAQTAPDHLPREDRMPASTDSVAKQEPTKNPVSPSENLDLVPSPSPLNPSFDPAASTNAIGTVASEITAGRAALAKGDLLAARTRLSAALLMSADESEREELRAELSRIASETILSTQVVSGDPVTARYTVQPGDTLEKIANANKVPLDLLANINRLVDRNRIRIGQTLKVIKGPFRAVVRSQSYCLDLFLNDIFIKRYPVGLGIDDSTPRGEWRVGTKLINPTYYPPRGGPIVQADDPQNPLGEHWIALEGVSGEALGQQRYGLHGTNDPSTIGKSLSLGCVRMTNQDVGEVYSFLVQRHSTVLVE